MKRMFLVLFFLAFYNCGQPVTVNSKPLRWSHDCTGNSWVIESRNPPVSFFKPETDLCLRRVGIFKRVKKEYFFSMSRDGQCESFVFKPDPTKKMGLYMRCEEY